MAWCFVLFVIVFWSCFHISKLFLQLIIKWNLVLSHQLSCWITLLLLGNLLPYINEIYWLFLSPIYSWVSTLVSVDGLTIYKVILLVEIFVYNWFLLYRIIVSSGCMRFSFSLLFRFLVFAGGKHRNVIGFFDLKSVPVLFPKSNGEWILLHEWLTYLTLNEF